MAFCVSCGNQLGNDERFCSKCGADQMAAAGARRERRRLRLLSDSAGTPPQYPPHYPPAAGMVPQAAMPPAAGMQEQNKIWYVVIGAAVLFALYHFSGALRPQKQQEQSGPINLIFVVSEDLAYQSPGM